MRNGGHHAPATVLISQATESIRKAAAAGVQYNSRVGVGVLWLVVRTPSAEHVHPSAGRPLAGRPYPLIRRPHVRAPRPLPASHFRLLARAPRPPSVRDPLKLISSKEERDTAALVSRRPRLLSGSARCLLISP